MTYPPLRISNSQIAKLIGFECCDGKWFWNYHKLLVKKRVPVNHNFIIGTTYHEGAALLYAGKSPEVAAKMMSKVYDKEVQSVRETCDVHDKDELTFVSNKVTCAGMIAGYYKYHKDDLKSMKQIVNEFEYTMPMPGHKDVSIMIKLDNVIEYKKMWMVHELKTVKSIDPKYVENRKFDFQTALYFHFYNSLFDKNGKPNKGTTGLSKMKPVKAILYDAIQKVQIRLKKGENRKAFLARVAGNYDGSDAGTKFYMEDFTPKIPITDIMRTLNESILRMQAMRATNTFTKSYASCAWCDYNTLCFDGGETRANLSLYMKKPIRK